MFLAPDLGLCPLFEKAISNMNTNIYQLLILLKSEQSTTSHIRQKQPIVNSPAGVTSVQSDFPEFSKNNSNEILSTTKCPFLSLILCEGPRLVGVLACLIRDEIK
jgi:hypothetical protein